MTFVEFLKYLFGIWIPINSIQVQQIHFPPDPVFTYDVKQDEFYSAIPNYDRKLPMKNPAVLTEYVNSNKEEVHNYFLSCLETAIKTDANETVLFKLGESRMIAKIVKEDYEESLKKLDVYFLKTEAYENVQKCRELIKQVYINRIISESKL